MGIGYQYLCKIAMTPNAAGILHKLSIGIRPSSAKLSSIVCESRYY